MRPSDMWLSLQVFESQHVLDNLLNAARSGRLASHAALIVTALLYMCAVSQRAPEARAFSRVRDLAELLAAQGVLHADRLQTILSAARSGTSITPLTLSSLLAWPGGRFRNDHRNFRDISVMPTHGESAEHAPAPFLPVVGCDERFLSDQARTSLCSHVLYFIKHALKPWPVHYATLGSESNPTSCT